MWKNLDLKQLRDSVSLTREGNVRSWADRADVVPVNFRSVPLLDESKFPPCQGDDGTTVDPVEVAARWIDRLDLWLHREGEAPGNLLIIGPAKTGKTTLLYSIYRSVVEEVRLNHVLVHRVNRLLLTIKAGFGTQAGELDTLDRAARATVLGLDDLGVQQNTDWSSSVIEELLDFRWSNCLPTLFTSNQDLDQLFEHYGETFMRRVADPDAGDHILEMTELVGSRG